MELGNTKPFEKPKPGQFLGTLVDVVDLRDVQTVRGPKNKVRLVWILGNLDGTPALDSEGNQFRAIETFNANMGEGAFLYKRIVQIINGAPPLMTNSEQLSELLLGRANLLFLVQAPNLRKPGDFYINVAGSSPLMPGMNPPRTPANFVRQKDKEAAAALDRQRIASQTPPPYIPSTAPVPPAVYGQQPAPPAAGYSPTNSAPPPQTVPGTNDRRF